MQALRAGFPRWEKPARPAGDPPCAARRCDADANPCPICADSARGFARRCPAPTPALFKDFPLRRKARTMDLLSHMRVGQPVAIKACARNAQNNAEGAEMQEYGVVPPSGRGYPRMGIRVAFASPILRDVGGLAHPAPLINR